MNKDIRKKIEDALDEVRPYLKDDGGDVEVIEITDDGIVKVQFKGACSSCDINMQTLKNGIEVVIKKAVPEIKKVVHIN